MKQVKLGLHAATRRHERIEVTVQLRKQKRDAQVLHKRQMIGTEEIEDTKSPFCFFTKNLCSEDSAVRYMAVKQLRVLLQVRDHPPIQEVLDSPGLVGSLVRTLLNDEDDVPIQIQASWALCNLVSGTTDQVAYVIAQGGLTALVHLVRHAGSLKLKEHAIWGLANIAGDGPALRNLVLATGIVDFIVASTLPVMSTNNHLAKLVSWFLMNLCRYDPRPGVAFVHTTMPLLTKMLQMDDKEIMSNACWCVCHIVCDRVCQHQKAEQVLACNDITRGLQRCLESNTLDCIRPAAKAIGTLSASNDAAQTDRLLANGAILGNLQSLLQYHTDTTVRKEVCWAISNIVAGFGWLLYLLLCFFLGTYTQIDHIVRGNPTLVPVLIHTLNHDVHDVCQEAIWALTNIVACGQKEQIQYLVKEGIIGALCNALRIPRLQTDCLLVVLEALQDILCIGNECGTMKFLELVETCGGLASLEHLRSHENDAVAETSTHLVKHYVNDEDDAVGISVGCEQVAEMSTALETTHRVFNACFSQLANNL